MLPAYSYGLVCQELGNAFRNRYRELSTKPVRMTGLLFARPDSLLAKTEIIPSLDYYHHRSGENIDFFCAGYGGYWEGLRNEFPDQIVVGCGEHCNWLFSAQKFDAFRREIEKLTKWRYSGGVDCLLTNAVYEVDSRSASIDFSSTICCRLEEMKHDGAIQSIGTFFESVFQFAESQPGDDPTWGFSDQAGVQVVGSALKRVVISLLPRKLGADVRKLAHFGVVDANPSG